MTRDPFTGWELDPDPLTAPPEPSPSPRRSGCSIFGWLALILVWVLW